tara:strand:- start:80 stop:280 length:201 start_codon:yes stop_codon:yes gene_type:complete
MSYIVAIATDKIEYHSKCCNAPPLEERVVTMYSYNSKIIRGRCMGCRLKTEFNWEVEKNEQNEPLF